MIIGISGKIGSGKDTVGKIIQYLTRNMEMITYNYEEFIDCYNYNYHKPNYKIKKYADKLKQIVSILTGIPVEDLEKQEVKDSVLGEEWWYWTNTLGKIVPYLEDKEYNRKLNKPTIRQLLQEIGTEAMRDVIHPNIWVNALFADYKEYKYAEAANGVVIDKPMYKYPNWIITDVRFPNELKAIKDRDGITIRVNRGLDLTYKSDLNSSSSPLEHAKRGKKLHPSETALDNAEFDYTIDNNGTIEELIEKVKVILIKEKII